MNTTNHSHITYGIGLSALNGQQYLDVEANKAQLYTSPGGQYLNFNSDITYKQSDPANANWGSSNGAGFGVDLFMDIPILSREDHSEKISIEAKDIGMIWWNKSSTTNKADSNYYYDGIAVNNILNLNSSSFNKLNADSILKKETQAITGKITSVLPAVFHINSLTTFGKWQLSKGLRYIYDANYKINVYLTANYFVTKKLMFSLGCSYGGYSKLSINAGAAWDCGKGFVLRVYSNNLEGYVAPQVALGQSAGLSIMKRF
jgi:hypothetical protein